MSLLNKLGLGLGAGTSRSVSRPISTNGHQRTPGMPVAAVGATRAPELRESTRMSNGLKEFLWNLD